jgi:hypothetical protein
MNQLDAIITVEKLDAIYKVYLEDKKAGKIVHPNIVKAIEPLMPAINELFHEEQNLDFIAYVIEAACMKAEAIDRIKVIILNILKEKGKEV